MLLLRTRMDKTLFLTVLALVMGGLVMVYSSSSLAAELRYHTEHYHFFARQAAAAAVAFLALTVLSQQDYRKFRSPQVAFAGLGIVIFLLVVVFFVDPRAHRWLPLRGFNLQPSEFAKPALIVFLAWFVTLRAPYINDRHTVRPAGLVLAILTGVVVVADFGTAMVLAATAAAVFYVAGLNRRYTMIAVSAMLVLGTIAVAAKPLRLKRVINFLDSKYEYLVYLDPEKKLKNYSESEGGVQDTTYQSTQAKIAMGAGGITGLGLMQSKQKLLFLPEAHTDFIYAIVGEELGLWGALLVLGGFIVILWRGFRLWWTASDDFGRYIALGVTTTLVFQALLNMSVVLDLGPTKGIPLPMISYGGSSLVSSLVCVGLLLSVGEAEA